MSLLDKLQMNKYELFCVIEYVLGRFYNIALKRNNTIYEK